jgi:hypothetical protein
VAVQSITPVDYVVFAGDTWQVTLTLVDGDGVPLTTLTGATGECLLSTVAGATVLTPAVTIDADEATVSWVAAAASTDDIAAQVLDYVVRVTWADGTVQTVQYGRLNVKRTRLS